MLADGNRTKLLAPTSRWSRVKHKLSISVKWVILTWRCTGCITSFMFSIFTVETFQTCLDLQPVPPMLVPAAQEGNQQLYVSPLVFLILTHFKLWPRGQWRCCQAEKRSYWRLLYFSLSSLYIIYLPPVLSSWIYVQNQMGNSLKQSGQALPRPQL